MHIYDWIYKDENTLFTLNIQYGPESMEAGQTVLSSGETGHTWYVAEVSRKERWWGVCEGLSVAGAELDTWELTIIWGTI